MHETTVTDTKAQAGYGPLGHGTWRVSCSCGWIATTNRDGKNAADMVANSHVNHQAGYHRSPVYGCVECGRY